MKIENQSLSSIIHGSVYDTLATVCETSFLVDAIAASILSETQGAFLSDVKSMISQHEREDLIDMAYDLIMANSANAENLNSSATLFYVDANCEFSIDTDDFRKFEILDRLMVVDMFVTGNDPLEVREYYDSLRGTDFQEIFSKIDNSLTLSDEETVMILNGLRGEFIFMNEDKEIELEEKVKEQAVIFHKMIKDCVLKGKMIKKLLDSNASMKVTL